MSHYKIGFHTGPGGNRTGIGAYWNALDAFGVPSSLISVDDYGPCYELEQIAKKSGVPHDIIFRFNVAIPGFNGDVPLYDLSPDEAGEIYYETIYEHLPPEFLAGDARKRVRIGIFNEVDKNRASWLGYTAIYIAQKAAADGIKISAFGFSTGEPEIDDWEEPGMAAYLRYCAASNGQADVMLHEYSLSLNLQDGFGYLIGRFQFLEDACINLGIDPVDVHITEFGWTYQTLPSPGEAMAQMAVIAELYDRFPWVKGVMIWYLGMGFGGIANLAQKLISPITWEALAWGYTPPSFPPEEPPSENEMIDLGEYFMPAPSMLHGPIYMLYNNWGQGPERCHLSRSPRGSANHFYVSKNGRWERRYLTDDWVWLQADTSRGDNEFYTISGDPWMPRKMCPGQVYERQEFTKIYNLNPCAQVDSGHLTSSIKMIGRNDDLSRQLGMDVIEFHWIVDGVVEEWQYYGKYVGLVMWKNRWGKESKLEEFVPVNEVPNVITWTCNLLDEWNPSNQPPAIVPPCDNTPPGGGIVYDFQEAWDRTVDMQVTGQGGMRLNAAAGIQQQVTKDSDEGNLHLQLVTDEIHINGVTYQAAESLTGACKRRIYYWSPGEPVRWTDVPSGPF